MTEQEKQKYTLRTEIIKALACPTRLFIVDSLTNKESLCVCELQKSSGVSISTLSRHLNKLKKAGIIEDRKEGRNIYYSLRICCLDQFFSCIETVLENRMKGEVSYK